MFFELILPDIGEGVVEAEIQRWHVQPCDLVEEDQPLVEVMTDKATVTIPSPRRGRVVKLHLPEGAMARVHDPLLLLALQADGEERPAESPALPLAGEGEGEGEGEGRGAAAPDEPSREGPDSGREVPPRAKAALATPAVRALARQLGLELGAVRGSGPEGRVTRGDVEAAHAASSGRTPSAAGAPAGDLEPPAAQRAAAPAHGDEVIPLRGVRRRMAERMAQSKRTAAHFTFVEQVDVTELSRVKERVAKAAEPEGVRVTFMPFLVKAVVAALRRHPLLNATFDEARGELRLRQSFHIGIAAATPAGLVVPVVRDAGQRSILELAREIERLAGAARAGQARPEDMGGSTFTISSLGARGGLFATPIINHPEVAILGVHRIRPTPVVRGGEIVARDVMHLSLSFDHRVIDGQVGAAFAYAVIGYLEDPSLLFMELV